MATKKTASPAVKKAKPELSLRAKSKRYKSSRDWMYSNVGMEFLGATAYVLSMYGFDETDIDRMLPIIGNTVWMFMK